MHLSATLCAYKQLSGILAPSKGETFHCITPAWLTFLVKYSCNNFSWHCQS